MMMADGTTPTSSNSLTLEDESFILMSKDVIDVLGLECEVCNEHFELNARPPKLLPCNHTVCLPCLLKIKESKLEEDISDDDDDNDFIECPSCRNEVPANDLETLPNDFRVVKGIDAVSKAKVSFKNVCFIHNCRKLEHFCGLCVVPVCPDCISLNHNQDEGHIIMELTQALEENESRFDDLERKCAESLSQMKIRDTYIENIICQLDVKENEEISRIIEHFDGYIEMLHERKEALTTKIQNKVNQRKSDMNRKALSLRESMNELKELYYGFRDSRESSDARGIFKFQKQFIDEENDLLKVSPNEDLCEIYKFTAVNEERFKTDLIITGDVLTRLDVTMLSP